MMMSFCGNFLAVVLTGSMFLAAFWATSVFGLAALLLDLEVLFAVVLEDSFFTGGAFAVVVFGFGVVFLVVEVFLLEGFGERKIPLLLPKSCPFETIAKTPKMQIINQNLFF